MFGLHLVAVTFKHHREDNFTIFEMEFNLFNFINFVKNKKERKNEKNHQRGWFDTINLSYSWAANTVNIHTVALITIILCWWCWTDEDFVQPSSHLPTLPSTNSFSNNWRMFERKMNKLQFVKTNFNVLLPLLKSLIFKEWDYAKAEDI